MRQNSRLILWLSVTVAVLPVCAIALLFDAKHREPDVVIKTDSQNYVQAQLIGDFVWDSMGPNPDGGVATEALGKLKRLGFSIKPDMEIQDPSRDISICIDAKSISYSFDMKTVDDPVEVVKFYNQAVAPWTSTPPKDEAFFSSLSGGGRLLRGKGYATLLVRKQDKKKLGKQPLQVLLSITTPR